MANVVMLRIRYADGHTEERAFAPGRFTVGRESGDVVLGGDSKVSANHAELVVGSGQVTITDMGSRNGTLDGSGKRLTGVHQLAVDQPVRLGRCSLTLARALGTHAGWTEAYTEARAEDPPPSAPTSRPHAPPTRFAAPAGRPSITRTRYDDALRELDFWRRLVKAVGLAFVGAALFAAAALTAGNDPAALVSGMTSFASGGMLAWLVRRRDEALEEYKQASVVAARGTEELARMGLGQTRRATQSSAWQQFRQLPGLAQALILLHAWWVLIPLWLLDSRNKPPADGSAR